PERPSCRREPPEEAPPTPRSRARLLPPANALRVPEHASPPWQRDRPLGRRVCSAPAPAACHRSPAPRAGRSLIASPPRRQRRSAPRRQPRKRARAARGRADGAAPRPALAAGGPLLLAAEAPPFPGGLTPG